jgi:hydrogenase maturation protease
MTGPLVLGIGNLLMGDEGVGVHAVRRLEGHVPPEVTVLDGGTGGFHLLGEITGYDPIVLIDATMDGQPAGTVSCIEPKYASDFPRTLTAHDIGLRDLVESAILIGGRLPRMQLVTVSVEALQPMELEMSAAVESAIPRVIAEVRRLLALS